MPNQSVPFDVFVSYHRREQDAVESLARRLRALGLRVFLDRWYLVPGRPWPEALEAALRNCRSVAVLIGPGELGSWQQREVSLAIDRQASEPGFPVIPVLLPGSEPVLGFLTQNTWIDLRQGIDDEDALRLLAEVARGALPAAEVGPAAAEICPYRGLLPFREEDAPLFFGRDEAIAVLHAATRKHAFVAVVGASGCGKSSVVRAGLIPALRRERELVWEIVTIRPGDHPFNALVAGLMPLLEPALTETDRLIEIHKQIKAITEGNLNVRDVLQRILAKQPGTNRLLLVVDQWEELYTLTKDENERRAFIDQILAAADAVTLTIVATLRGDYIGHALAYRPLSDRMQGAQVNLGPMNRNELTRAIRGPAERVGLRFEQGLVERLLDDAGDEPGHLPLLEFALRRLWEERSDAMLAHAAYEEMGGMRGAIAERAERICGALPLKEQEAVQRVFLQLVRPGDEGGDTRRRIFVDDLRDLPAQLVKDLSDDRLLVTAVDPLSGRITLELAHEALISSWKRLREWIVKDHEFLLWRERLCSHLAEWKRKNRDNAGLLRGAYLEEAEKWEIERAADLLNEEQAYIAQSRQLREQEAREAEEKRQREQDQAMALQRAEQARTATQRRARAWLKRAVWAGIAVCFAAVGARLWYLDAYVNEDVRFYNTFTRQAAEPLAIGELSEAQVRAREVSMRVTRTGRLGKIRSIEAIDSSSRCTTRHEHGRGIHYEPGRSFAARECLWEFVYDASGRLTTEKGFNPSGKLQWSLIITPSTDRQKIRARLVGPDGTGRRLADSRAEFITLEHSEAQNEVLERYFSPDGRPTSVPDGEGVYGRLKRFDRLGCLVEETTLGPDGKPLPGDLEIARISMTCGEMGNIADRRYFGIDGQPLVNREGAHREVIRYDANGNSIEARYFDAAGRAVHVKSGYHIVRAEYDASGNTVAWSYYDAADRPVAIAGAYHRETASYDDSGYRIEWAYFDVAGQPIVLSSGVHRINARNDAGGNVMEVVYFDASGTPVNAAAGYHRAAYRYDDDGNELEVAFFDAAGQPAAGPGGHHRMTTEYDVRGARVAWKRYDASGAVIESKSPTDKIRAMLLKRPAKGQFREQLFWLVDIIHACKASNDPTLMAEGAIMEAALKELGSYLETGDQAALERATRAVEHFARVVKASVAREDAQIDRERRQQPEPAGVSERDRPQKTP